MLKNKNFLIISICVYAIFLFNEIIPQSISEKENNNEVRFIVFGDSQFGNPPEYERMIYEAEMLHPKFVVQVGDLIHGYTRDKEQLNKEWKRFKNQIKPLTSPFYPVPGNHDVVTDEAEEIYSEIWGQDKLLYSFDYDFVHCIVLNTWWGTEDDRISEWQQEWLINDLEMFANKNGGKNSKELSQKSIFVFFHSPLWKYNNESESYKDWQKVHNILKEYPIRLVVAGHFHEYVWEEIDGINYLIINSAGVRNFQERAGMFSSFLNVTALPNGDVKYATIKAGSILPLDTVDPFERKFASSYQIKEKTIQISDWKEGNSLNTEIIVPIENELNEERIYNLTWEIPYGVEVEITPFSVWIDVPANEVFNQKFTFRSQNIPSKTLMPKLKISSEKVLRSGVLQRNIENQLLAQNNLNADPNLSTAIKLNAPEIFEGYYYLFSPPKIKVKKTSQKIIIDGIINNDEWSTSEKISDFQTSLSETTEVSTEIKLLYDNDFLYLAAKMEESFPQKMFNTAQPPIPFTWNDDDIELFFDTKQTQKDYIRLFQNSFGTRFNSLERWVENKYFESEYESRIFTGDNFWSIEMKIPWSDINLEKPPISGNKWGFNIGRHRQQNKVKEMYWSGPLYQPQKYGVLIFE